MRSLVVLAVGLVLGAGLSWLNNADRDLDDVRRELGALVGVVR